MWQTQTKNRVFCFYRVLTRLKDISIQLLAYSFTFTNPLGSSLHLENLDFTTPGLFYSLPEPLKTSPPHLLLYRPQALFQHLPVFSQLAIIYLLLLPPWAPRTEGLCLAKCIHSANN